ncbi:hypothetical protein Vretimale_2450 [Volvox reticuliferus]|uniref:Flavin-containing monooxygenase n=1 Tax=Volvox reticuliferus TaxID=1737510 RepID=A0A8J4D7K2_9CHLO|nr:hypothetical protein Vretifemale_4744 [Volvox reticuliferus]GIL96691.1 hypothetical protein Vretimale_2450 [Volvox reticuliferus]
MNGAINNCLSSPILVVGAGVAGLQTARALLKRGFKVLVIDQSEDVGGVWIRNYQGYGLQVPWEMYQFPEFPYPGKLELQQYPSGDAVREYVQAYARHFGLYRHILFGCRLVSLRRKKQWHPPQPPSCQQQQALHQEQDASGAAEAPLCGCTELCSDDKSPSANSDGYGGGDGCTTFCQGDVLTKKKGTYSKQAVETTAVSFRIGIQRQPEHQHQQPQVASPSQPSQPARCSSFCSSLTSTQRLQGTLALQSPTKQPKIAEAPCIRTGTGSGTVCAPTATGTATATMTTALLDRFGSSTLEFRRTLMASLMNAELANAQEYADAGEGSDGHNLDSPAAPNAANYGGASAVLCDPALDAAPDSCSAPSSLSQDAGAMLQDAARVDVRPCSHTSRLGQQQQPQEHQQRGDQLADVSSRVLVGNVSVPDSGQRREKGTELAEGACCCGVRRYGQRHRKREQEKGQQLKEPQKQQQPSFGGGSLSDGEWEAEYEDLTTGRRYKMTASYCVLCTGVYATPFIPSIPGQELYRGLQVHSRDFTDASVVGGKRVLVVGAGKTAVDIITELTATSKAASVTLLYRRPHWPLPRYVGRVSMKKLAYTRLMPSVLLPNYYDTGICGRAANTCLTPLRKAFWARFMARVNRALGVEKMLGKPDRPICQDIWYSGQVLDAVKWPEVINNPKVTAIQGEVERFTPVSAVLRDGTELDPDVVLYATGYSNHYTFMEPEVRAALNVQHDGLYLYRHVLAPGLPGLAFVGAEVSTFNNILTAALQAEWLAAVLAGEVTLPRVEAMAADVAAQQEWRRRTMPPHKLRGGSVMLYMQCYHDQLVRDMGLHTRRKHCSWRRPFAECFEPYTAADYVDIFWRTPDPVARERGSGNGKSAGSPAMCGALATTAPTAAVVPRAVDSEAAVAAADITVNAYANLVVPQPSNIAADPGALRSTSWRQVLAGPGGSGGCPGSAKYTVSRFHQPAGWPPSAPGPTATGSRCGTGGLKLPFSASISTLARLLPGAQLGHLSSTGPDRLSSTTGQAKTQHGEATAGQGATATFDSPTFGCTSSALYSMMRASSCNTGGSCIASAAAAAQAPAPLIQSVLTPSAASLSPVATAMGGSGSSQQEAVGSGPAHGAELQGRVGVGVRVQSPARMPGGLSPAPGGLAETIQQSSTSALHFDEQDTLYSLDTLPPALQAYRHTRVRVPASPGSVDSPAAVVASRPLAPALAGATLRLPREEHFRGVEDRDGGGLSPFGTAAAAKYVGQLSLSASPSVMMTRTRSIGGEQADARGSNATIAASSQRAAQKSLSLAPWHNGIQSPPLSPLRQSPQMAASTPSLLRAPGNTNMESPGERGGTNSANPVPATAAVLGASASTDVQRRSSSSFVWPRRPTTHPNPSSDVGLASLPTAAGAEAVSAQRQEHMQPPSAGSSVLPSLPLSGPVPGHAAHPAAGCATEGPKVPHTSSCNGYLMARAKGTSTCSPGGDSCAGNDGCRTEALSHRADRRGFSLGTLLMRVRNNQAAAHTVRDISGSRMEPSSAAVSELAYKVLPPRHVEEALAASAAAAAATVPVTKPDEAGPRKVPRPTAPPAVRGNTAAGIPAPSPAATPQRFVSPAPLPLPLCGSSHQFPEDATQLSMEGTDHFNTDGLLLPTPPPCPGAEVSSTPPGVAAAVAGVSGSHLLVGRATSITASSSGISYMPSSSAMSFPHCGDATGVGNGGGASYRHFAAYYIDQLQGVLNTRASFSPATGTSGVTGCTSGGAATSGGGSGRIVSSLGMYIEAHGAAVAAAAAAISSARWTLPNPDDVRGNVAATIGSPITSSGVSYVPSCSTVAPPLVPQHWQ